MLTIAGSGINDYDLNEVIQKLDLSTYDAMVMDPNYDKPKNRNLLNGFIEVKFLKYGAIKEQIIFWLKNNKKVLYIVSGNPLFYSATENLLSQLPIDMTNKTIIVVAESSKDYLLKQLHLSENSLQSVSLHGKEVKNLLLKDFLTCKMTFIVCDEKSLHSLNDLTSFIQDQLEIIIGCKLGYKEELIEVIDLKTLTQENSIEQIKEKFMPYVVLIKQKNTKSSSYTNDSDIETTKGMLTKRDKRSLTLEALELEANMLLWDIGAGSGAVAIDAYKLFKTRSILFEKDPLRCKNIEKNIKKNIIPAIKLIEGNILDYYNTYESPDRIFVGGGGLEIMQQLDKLYYKMNDSGVMVINLVGLEHLAESVSCLRGNNIDYLVRTLDISYYEKLSDNIDLSISNPKRTLYQIIVKKEKMNSKK